MKSLKHKLLGFFILTTGILSLIAYRSYQDKKVVRNNYRALTEELVVWKTKDSLNVAEVTALQIDKNTLKKVFQEQAEEIKDLKIRLKDVQSYSKTSTTTYITIRDTLYDSLIVNSASPSIDTLRCINFNEPFLTVRGCCDSNSFFGDIIIKDTITQIVSIERKRFLFWKYGVKRIKQTLKSSNPYTIIDAAEYIEIK